MSVAIQRSCAASPVAKDVARPDLVTRGGSGSPRAETRALPRLASAVTSGDVSGRCAPATPRPVIVTSRPSSVTWPSTPES